MVVFAIISTLLSCADTTNDGAGARSNIRGWPVEISDSAPARRLGLFIAQDDPSNPLCLQKNSSGAGTTQNGCDLFNKNQWYYKDSDNTNKHFATQTACANCDGKFVSLRLRDVLSFYTLDDNQPVFFNEIAMGDGGASPATRLILSSSEHQQRLTIDVVQSSLTVDSFIVANGDTTLCSQASGANIAIPIAVVSEGNIRIPFLSFQAPSRCRENSSRIRVSISINQITSTTPLDTFTLTVSSSDATVADANGVYTALTGPYLLAFMLNNPAVSTVRFIDLPGSVDESSLAYYARYVRAAGWTTYLPATGQASSGGVDIFLAGSRRVVETGGFLGVHSWQGGGVAGGNLPEGHVAHQSYIDYITTMLGSVGREFYFFTLKGDRMASGGVDICKMTTDQIRRYITTDIKPTPAGGVQTAFDRNMKPPCQNFDQ